MKSALVSFVLLVLACEVSPTWALCTLRVRGQSADLGFGIATALPGDLNGDGYPDFVVGATYISGSPADAHPGRVSIFFGGPPVHHVADLVLTGEANGDRFGFALAGLGDFNADGYADLAVGAYGNDAGGTNAGRVYVYFGGPTLDATADLVLTGHAADENFGYALDGAGHPSADDSPALVIGAPYARGGGRAYIYLGGAAFDAVADRTLTTPSGSLFGSAVKGLGHFNTDSRDDFAISAPPRVHVYHGSAVLDTQVDLTITGPGAAAHFGEGLGAGDVTGDGWPDLVIGAPHKWNESYGGAWVYFGGPSADGSADVSLAGSTPGSWFGRSVAAGADLDGDGTGDIIVGAPMLDTWDYSSRIFVYWGGPALDGVADRVLPDPDYSAYGFSCAMGPDMDGDGKGEMIAGAYRTGGAIQPYWISLGLPPDLVLTSSPYAKIEPGDSTTVRFSVRNADRFALTLDYRVANSVGWARDSSGTVELAPGDSACIETRCIASTDGSCSSVDVLTFTVQPRGCVDPSATISARVLRLIRPPELSCAGIDSIVSPGDTLRARICVRNPNRAERAYSYWIGGEDQWCEPAPRGSVTLAPGDSFCLTRTCVVPLDAPSGSYGSVWLMVVPACAAPNERYFCFQDFTVRSDPVAAVIHDVSAEASPGSVTLRWVTAFDRPGDVQVYRASAPRDEFQPIGSAIRVTAGRTISSYRDDTVEPAHSYAYKIAGREDAAWTYSPPVQVMIPAGAFALSVLGAHPSPGGETRLQFELDRPATVRLDVFDVAGRLVRTITQGSYGPGTHVAGWDGRTHEGGRAAPGVYWAKLESAGRARSLKLVVTRN